MQEEKDMKRNRPSEEGRQNDPNIRDESAIRPGASTISSSDTDELNNQVTKTASDSFRPGKEDPKADKRFDEVTGEEE